MLDFRCFIVPRFVYATGEAFANDRTEEMYLSSAEVKERLHELAEITTRLAGAIESVDLLWKNVSWWMKVTQPQEKTQG